MTRFEIGVVVEKELPVHVERQVDKVVIEISRIGVRHQDIVAMKIAMDVARYGPELQSVG